MTVRFGTTEALAGYAGGGRLSRVTTGKRCLLITVNITNAVISTSNNAERNGVANRVEFLEGDAAALAPLVGPVDLLLSNILRSTNSLLLPIIGRALRAGGVAIFSGMEQSEAEEFRFTLGQAGFAAFQETLEENDVVGE